MNVNKAFILGNVTREPEVRSLPSGQQVTNFSIATNRYYTTSSGEKKEEAEFHNIVCFGKLADISSRYLRKGSLVFIEGRIKTRNWQDAAGQKHYKTEVIAETMQLGPRGSGAGESNGGGYKRPAFGQQQPEPEPQANSQDIPIIEENYTPPAGADNKENQSKVTFEDNAADEIDVKDIPF